MNKLLFIFVLLPALAFADMSWKQCGSKAPVPVNVTSDFCSATPCQFKQGENIGFTMNFIPDHDAQTLTLDIKGKVVIIEIKYPVRAEHLNACDALIQGECPVVKDEEYVYDVVFPMEAPLTNINALISVQLNDENGKGVVCFAFDAHIAP